MSRFDHTITVAEAKKSVDKLWFTQKDAASYLGMSVKTISRLREQGKLPWYQLDRMVLLKKDDIDRLIERHRVC